MASFLLVPPYRHWDVPTGPINLGAILFHDLDGSRESVATAAEWQRVNPWCPSCVRLAVSADASAVDFVHETGALPGIVPQGPSRCLPSGAAILTALERRRPPSVPTISEYVVRRLGCHGLRDALIDAMSHRNEPAHARSVRRRLAAFGRWRPWEWHRIAGMALTRARAHLTLDRLADQVGTEARSLRRWIQELLAVDVAAFRHWSGWEWIVEASLRRGGYCAAAVEQAAIGTRGSVSGRPAIERPEILREEFGTGYERHAGIAVVEASRTAKSAPTALEPLVGEFQRPRASRA